MSDWYGTELFWPFTISVVALVIFVIWLIIEAIRNNHN